MEKIIFRILLVVSLAVLVDSCAVIEPHERYLLNDPDMSFQSRVSGLYDSDAWQYREGSGSVNGTHSGGGGCGCN